MLKQESISMPSKFHRETKLFSRFLETYEKLVYKFYKTADPDDFPYASISSQKLKEKLQLISPHTLTPNWHI